MPEEVAVEVVGAEVGVAAVVMDVVLGMDQGMAQVGVKGLAEE